jgi:hypothetical protein
MLKVCCDVCNKGLVSPELPSLIKEIPAQTSIAYQSEYLSNEIYFCFKHFREFNDMLGDAPYKIFKKIKEEFKNETEKES